MLFEQVARTSAEVARTSGKKKKVELIAALLRDVPPDERAIAARHLSGEVGHKLGIGYATVAELRGSVAPASAPTWTLGEIVCDGGRAVVLADVAAEVRRVVRVDRDGDAAAEQLREVVLLQIGIAAGGRLTAGPSIKVAPRCARLPGIMGS